MKNLVNLWLVILVATISPAINAEGLSAAQVYEKVSKSVVLVKSSTKTSLSQGSGVSVGYGYKNGKPDRTWIITNAHVIVNLSNIEIQSQGVKYNARVAHIDEINDVASLVVDNDLLTSLNGQGGVNGIETKIGEKVYAIGSPLGLVNSISEGIISGKREKNGVSLIQTTAAISSGNSGGGLFNDRGELIGITTFKMKNAENINFAIDSSYFKLIQDSLIASAIFSISMNIQESHSLTSWMALNKTSDGEYIHRYVVRVFEEGMKQKGDAFDYVVPFFAPLMLQYKNSNLSNDSLPNNPQRNTQIFKLNCILKSTLDGQILLERVFIFDEANSKVVGFDDAIFKEGEIIFFKGNYSYQLNRYSGSFTLSGKSGANFALGQCAKVESRAF